MPMPSSNREARLLRFGVFEVDLDAGERRKNGARLRLQEQPFQVLTALLENAGKVVTRDELREKIWPADTFVDFDHSLNTAVNKIRESLGDSASSPRFVETLARRGYRFIAPVDCAGAAAESAPTHDQGTRAGAPAPHAIGLHPELHVPVLRRAVSAIAADRRWLGVRRDCSFAVRALFGENAGPHGLSAGELSSPFRLNRGTRH
jgi:DNA-binding winged helix-turn-helix (wHTH) protein